MLLLDASHCCRRKCRRDVEAVAHREVVLPGVDVQRP